MQEKNIFFVRHAESQANAGFKTENAESILLSVKGREQAEILACNFPIVPELIIVSTFLRTQETASPLIEKHPEAKVEIWDMIHEFTYLDRNKHKNKTSKDREPFVIEFWDKNDPHYIDGQEEESFFGLLKRAETFLRKLDEREEKSIAVFSHGQFITALKIIKKLNTEVENLTKKELEDHMSFFRNLQHTAPIGNTAILTFEDLIV